MTEPANANATTAAFTRETQHKLTALRVTAYTLSICFMIVMVVRGVWLTGNQMEAGANQSIRMAAAVMTTPSATGTTDPSRAAALLKALAPPNVDFRFSTTSSAQAKTRSTTANDNIEVRTFQVADGRMTLVATIDHAAIRADAFRANLPYIVFVLALGLPTVVIFLYMGWLVNRPALQLLAFAQAGEDENQRPPKLPAIWNSVLARLKQLKDSQTQMQAFLDNAPIGMMLRDPSGKLVMVNRYGASFYDESPEQLATRPVSFFNAYFPESEHLARPLFLDPLTRMETTSVETEFHGPSGEHLTLLIKSFPVLNSSGTVGLVGNFLSM